MSETKKTGIPIQEWLENNKTKDEMHWKGAADEQITFMARRIMPLFGIGLSHQQMVDSVSVISTHYSKSIELPVYFLERPDRDLKVVLRGNFYDWKMSVLSDTPIEANFDGLFHTTPPIEPDYTGDPLHPVYFEGFPEELVLPYYSQTDGRQWSAQIGSEEDLYTSMFLMMRSLGIIKPLKWHTKESHRKELGLD